MYPHALDEVVFREAYAAQGDAAPVYLVEDRSDTHATIYPKDPKQRTYPRHDPNLICPPQTREVALGLLRHAKPDPNTEQALMDAVCKGKYRTVGRLLKRGPLLDPHGNYAFPNMFHAITIGDMPRWRKTMAVLRQYGAKPDQHIQHRNCTHWTLMHEAIQRREYEKFDELCMAGLPMRAKHWDLDLLDLAVRARSFDAIGALLLRGYSPTEVQGKLPSLTSGFERFDPDSYKPLPAGGTTLPIAHMVLLRQGMALAHVLALFDAMGNPHWSTIRDHNGKTALEMAEQVGGSAWEYGRALKAHLEHEMLQAQTTTHATLPNQHARQRHGQTQSRQARSSQSQASGSYPRRRL